MPWQIQVRRNIDGREWEPVSVERCRVISGAYERQYHYETLDEVKLAFAEYVDIEGGLPNLLIRLATGQTKFTDKYEVRFVGISEPGIIWCPETVPEPKTDPPNYKDFKRDPDILAAKRGESCYSTLKALAANLPANSADESPVSLTASRWTIPGLTVSVGEIRRALKLPAATDSTTDAEQEPPKPFRKAEPGEPTPLYPDAATAERIACIADIEAAFYGDGRITDRYDIMNFILDRINRRGNA